MDDYRIAPHSEGALFYAPGSFGSLFGDAGRGDLFSRERAIRNEVGKPGKGPIDVAISLTGTEKETLEIGPDHFAIRAVLSGEEAWVSAGQEVRLRQGSILLIPPQTVLTLRRPVAGTSITLQFPLVTLADFRAIGETQPGSFAEPMAPEDFPLHVRPVENRLPELLNLLAAAPEDAGRLTLLEIRSLATGLLRSSQEELARIPALRSAARKELFRRACIARSAIDHDPRTALGELAARACISPFHLHRVFAAAFGMPPGQYSMMQKMEISRALLRDTDLHVKVVANRAGFENSSSFVRSFRKVNGVTPQAYRKSAVSVGRTIPSRCGRGNGRHNNQPALTGTPSTRHSQSSLPQALFA